MELASAQFDMQQAADALAAAHERVSDLTGHLDDSHDHILVLEAHLSEAVAARQVAEGQKTELEDQVGSSSGLLFHAAAALTFLKALSLLRAFQS
jgi:hypothetical protein